MPTKVRITAGAVSVTAILNDSKTALSVARALPIEAEVNRWGEEIYFAISVKERLAADARTEMAIGELAYWPPGSAFCIFWGPTPASSGQTPVAASDVNPIGQIEGDATVLSAVEDGTPIRIELAE